MPRDEVFLELRVEGNLDVHKAVQVKLRAHLGRLVVLNIEVQYIEHGLENGRPMVLWPPRRKLLDRVQMLARHASRELYQGHYHGEGGALDGHKRLVHVDAHGVGNLEEGLACLAAENATHDLDEQLLGVPSAKVEADRFEDQALESNDDFAW